MERKEPSTKSRQILFMNETPCEQWGSGSALLLMLAAGRQKYTSGVTWKCNSFARHTLTWIWKACLMGQLVFRETGDHFFFVLSNTTSRCSLSPLAAFVKDGSVGSEEQRTKMVGKKSHKRKRTQDGCLTLSPCFSRNEPQLVNCIS